MSAAASNPFLDGDKLEVLHTQLNAAADNTFTKATTKMALLSLQASLSTPPESADVSAVSVPWQSQDKATRIAFCKALVKYLSDLITTPSGRAAIRKACKDATGRFATNPNIFLLKIFAFIDAVEVERAELDACYMGLRSLRKAMQIVTTLLGLGGLAVGIGSHFFNIGSAEASVAEGVADLAPPILALISTVLYIREVLPYIYAQEAVRLERETTFRVDGVSAEAPGSTRRGKIQCGALSFGLAEAAAIALCVVPMFLEGVETNSVLLDALRAGGLILALAFASPFLGCLWMLWHSRESLFGVGRLRMGPDELNAPLLQREDATGAMNTAVTGLGGGAAATARGGVEMLHRASFGASAPAATPALGATPA